MYQAQQYQIWADKPAEFERWEWECAEDIAAEEEYARYVHSQQHNNLPPRIFQIPIEEPSLREASIQMSHFQRNHEAQLAQLANLVSLQHETEKKQVMKIVHRMECVICGGAHMNECCLHITHGEAVKFTQDNGPHFNSFTPHPSSAYGNQRSTYTPHQNNLPPPEFHDPIREPSLRDFVTQMAKLQIEQVEQLNQSLSQLVDIVRIQQKTNETVADELKELKMQLEARNERETRKQPSVVEHPPAEQLKALHLRSGAKIPSPAPARKRTQDTETEGADQSALPAQQKPIFVQEYPPPPFPQRVKKKKEEKGMQSFIDLLRPLLLQIPFAEALASIPSYAKYMKDLLSNKSKFKLEDIVRTEVVNALMSRDHKPPAKSPPYVSPQRRLIPKMKEVRRKEVIK